MYKHILRNQNTKKWIIYLTLGLYFYLFILVAPQQAGPQSSTYEIKEYGFGSGGTSGTDSTTYSLYGFSEEASMSALTSTSYQTQPGLSFLIPVNTPPAPTFTNPSNYYNKLKIVINTASNPTDTQYAISISPDNFSSTTNYVQADTTLGNSAVWQTYTSWGGASGTTIIGLTPGTTYTAKVTAKQGNFTQSPWSATAQVATINPTFTFILSGNGLTFSQLDPGTVINSTSTITATVVTNATGGAVIYAYDNNAGLFSSGTGYTINATSGDLSSATEGYGIQGTATSGAPMEILAPYNGNILTDIIGPVDTTKRPIFDSSGAPVNGTGTFKLKAKASATAKAATDYTDTITVIASGTF